jgi:penicillin-binding protein 2
VVSTLDAALQRKAEELLVDKAGAIIALDPRNGEVLALASKPDFDSNLFIASLDQETWRRIVTDPSHPLQNRAISGLYPLGSAFKIVTGTAGLETGAISPDEFTSCPGYFLLKGTRFNCWQEKGHGRVNFHDAMRNSCNVYFYRLSLRRAMGPDILRHYAAKFGLGELTGIDISGEKRGFIPSSRDIPEKGRRWGAADTVNMSIGQGMVLVTPLQVANMMALIAVGKNYKLHLVKRIELVTGETEIIQPEMLQRLNISSRTLNVLRQSLRAVVNNYGTGALARLPDVVAAGKTGTAETSSGEPHAWFTGYAPFTNPEIVVAIIVEHGASGAKTAAPLAREIFQTYFDNKRNHSSTLLARKDGRD